MTGRIPRQFIDELVDRADIVEVIDRRVPLRRAGHEYKACCPFHDEKTPSFTVSPAKQFYHCFGCGAHGTAISFLMEYENLGFVEAVEELAELIGLEIPRESGQPAPAKDNAIYPLLEAAAAYYRRCLRAEPTAIEYLRSRGLSGQTTADFGLGWAPDRWDSLLRELGDTADTERRLEEAGMLIRRDDGGCYDRFRGRIMFPIRDSRGRVIGFGGRLTGPGEPKYLNSPETPVFHKGRELFGLVDARKAARDLSRLLVVEGYMDVIALAEHGIRNAVATLGTATTPEHLDRLFRATREVVFCFDGDRAGRVAAWRALEHCLAKLRDGRTVRFSFLPDGDDPDSFVRREGAAGFEAALELARPLSVFFVEHLAAEVEWGSPEALARVTDIARPLIGRIPHAVYRDKLIDLLADTVGENAGVLRRRLARDHGSRGGAAAARRTPSAGRGNLVRQAISLLVHYPALARVWPEPDRLNAVQLAGVPLLVEMLEELVLSPQINTAGVLERWRERPEGVHLARLAAQEILVGADDAATELSGILDRLLAENRARRTQELLQQAREAPLDEAAKTELRALLKTRWQPRDEN